MKIIKKLLSVLICLSLLGSMQAVDSKAASTTYNGSAVTTARSLIWKDINIGSAGSAAIAIMDHGNIVYSEGFGMVDRENSIPVDPQTVFNIGSVSKVFTATAIMLLVDEGKIELDKPVTAYLPEFKMADERYKDITVRMLLNHTSGLPGSTSINACGSIYHKDVYKELIEILAQEHLKAKPGDIAPYCNDGFTLAEMIVAKISGKSFSDFLKERIYQTLSMAHTGAGVGMLQNQAKVARYYEPDKIKSQPLEVLSVLGAGGLSATAEDLCRFADLFSGEGSNLLSAKSLKEMTKTQPAQFYGKLRESNLLSYGLGWDFTDLEPYKSQGIHVLAKGGNTGTYTSEVFTVPELRISVAIVETGAASGAMNIANKTLQAYLIEKGLMKTIPEAFRQPISAQSIPEKLKKYEGYYYDNGIFTRVALDMKKGLLTFYTVDNSSETMSMSAVYNKGYFYPNGENDPEGKKFYFTSYYNKDYLIVSYNAFQADTISKEKLEAISEPAKFAVTFNVGKWLLRNGEATDSSTSISAYVADANKVDFISGYLYFGGSAFRVESSTFAGMPAMSVRDEGELKVIKKDNHNWIWYSGMVYMPENLAKTLSVGDHAVKLGSDGYNQWLKVAKDCILSFKLPDQGRAIVFGADNTLIYDSNMDSGKLFVPAGSFVQISGNAGDTVPIKAEKVK